MIYIPLYKDGERYMGYIIIFTEGEGEDRGERGRAEGERGGRGRRARADGERDEVEDGG